MIKPLAAKKTDGVALVITLSLLVIVTILVVGFTTSMRTERQASTSIANSAMTSVAINTTIDHAIALLDRNIPQPLPPGAIVPYPDWNRFGGPSAAVTDITSVNWVTQPGMLTTVAHHSFTNSDTILEIPLSSNPNANYSSTSQDAELNVPLLSGSGYTILPTPTGAGTPRPMRVAWIPITKDPSSVGGATNPIVARYGFWVDDESTKININTAYGKPSTMNFAQLTPGVTTVNSSTYPLGHPSSVNLNLLGSLDRNGLSQAVQTRGGLMAVEDIKNYVSSGSPSDFFNKNRFDLTAFGRAPEFNVFGKSKLYFMRRANGNQLGRPIFQFFRDREGPNYFPMEDNATGADRHALYYTAAAISDYLNRQDWPGMPADANNATQGLSFVKKWDKNVAGGVYAGLAAGDMGKREADQFAWNLVAAGSFAAGDFTGFTPSTLSAQYFQLANKATAGEVGFVSVNKPNNDAVVGKLSGKAMLPSFPTPFINEVCLVISPESYTTGTPPAQRYKLNISLQVELWLPPGYPAYDFNQAQTTIGLTNLSYHVTQASPGNADASQSDAKYVDLSPAPDDNGIRKLWMRKNTGIINPGQYVQLTTILPFYIHRNFTGFNPSPNGAEDFTPSGLISLDFKMRLFGISQQRTGGTYGTKHTYQLIPVWDTHDPSTANAPTSWDPPAPPNPPVSLAPPGDDSNDYIQFSFTLDPASFSSGQAVTRSLEVADPRIGGIARSWQQATHFTEPSTQSADTMGRTNDATTTSAYDTSKLAFIDLTQPGPASNRPSTGFISVLPTGMQRGIAGSTVTLRPNAANNALPDWLLLDLVAPNVVATNLGSMSYMNTTTGKINVNTQIRPNAGKFALDPRFVPLQALLQDMRPSSTVIGQSPPTAASVVVQAILDHSFAVVAPAIGHNYGAPAVYDYEGEVCEIEGVANVDEAGSATGPDWNKESIIRNLGSTITTKSNVFSVWGVAQTVKKNPANTDASKQGVFETKAGGAVADDSVTGEKRFMAVIERYVWPGNDSTPGNGHVPASGGTYDQLSSGQTQPQPGNPPPTSGGTWERIDGPDTPTYPVTPTAGPWTAQAPNYVSTTLDSSNNPARALMKYRVIYFKVLTE